MKRHMSVWIYDIALSKTELRSTFLDSIIRVGIFFTYFSQFARILFALTSEMLYPVSVRT